ncbi:MAG: helix-turn-helix transcriptional regulator [Chloroflexi bacterium]|nr:helix-turn-helix transcriptional regulator [Chloroflexota bacterium]
MTEPIPDLEDMLAAAEAARDTRVPHEVALAIIDGANPVRAFRNHRGLTLGDVSERAGISVSYLSEIEHGRKPGSVAALTRVAAALGATIDALVVD